jgi:hypothetical protein
MEHPTTDQIAAQVGYVTPVLRRVSNEGHVPIWSIIAKQTQVGILLQYNIAEGLMPHKLKTNS